jgi:CARDB
MKKYLAPILFAIALFSSQCLADANSGYSWDQQMEPWSLAATTTGHSIQLTWKAPTSFAMTTDNGYVVLIQKDAPILSDDVYLTNSKLLKAAAFEPLGTTQHTFTDLSAGTYYFKVGVGLCQSPTGQSCQWADMGYFSTQDFSVQIVSAASQTASSNADGGLKPDLTISVAKALTVTRRINGAAKRQYKIGVTVKNAGKGDAVGDVNFSYNSSAPILAAKGGLKAHTSRKVFIYVDTTEKGKPYTFTVDPGNLIDESNESNNTATRVVGK